MRTPVVTVRVGNVGGVGLVFLATGLVDTVKTIAGDSCRPLLLVCEFADDVVVGLLFTACVTTHFRYLTLLAWQCTTPSTPSQAPGQITRRRNSCAEAGVYQNKLSSELTRTSSK